MYNRSLSHIGGAFTLKVFRILDHMRSQGQLSSKSGSDMSLTFEVQNHVALCNPLRKRILK